MEKSGGSRGVWRQMVVVMWLSIIGGVGFAQTNVNSWVNPGSGRWDDTNSWSLGILPGATQSILITNDGTKTVEINASVANSAPQSLSINQFGVSGTNTLRLDNIGTNTPLQVAVTGAGSSSVLGLGATLENLGSRLIIGSTNSFSSLTLEGGGIVQDGGFINIVGALYGGNVILSNGVLNAGGYCEGGGFQHYGGTANFGDLELEGGYDLYGGNFSAGLLRMGYYGLEAGFTQHSGTAQINSLVLMASPIDAPGASYTMSGGAAYIGSASLGAGCNFSIANATVALSGEIAIQGDYIGHFDTVPTPSSAGVADGALTAQTISIGGIGSFFNVTRSQVALSGSLQLGFGYGYGPPGELTFDGGSFRCLSVVSGGRAIDITQSSGDFVATNVFQYAGYFNYQPCYYCTNYTNGFAHYKFAGGTLTASNIELYAAMDIGGSTQANRITNPGYFLLAGELTVGDANEQLGPLIVTNQVLDGATTSDVLLSFAGTNTVLRFADSSQQVWSNSVTLLVSNWNGSFGGGGAEQLRFGNSSGGLTQTQLSQIAFVNPVGLPPSVYRARILSNGEVVPSTSPINYWIKGATGAWQETNSWSLHALPDASQSIGITGSWLNVHIDPDTKNNYPQTMTVGDLTVGGSATTFMLNYISENIPFHALNGVTVFGESPTNQNSLLCLQSGMYVDNGGLYVTNGQVRQDGGFIQVTNGDTWLNNGEYYLTNGLFGVGTLWLGWTPSHVSGPGNGAFFQYGGTVTASNIHDGCVGATNVYNIYGGELDAGSIQIGDISSAGFNQYGGRVNTGGISLSSQSAGGDQYNLFDGELDVAGGLNLFSYYGNEVFFQGGGTNRSSSLSMSSITLGGETSYVLGAGLLSTSNVFLGFNATLEQDGGEHIVSGTLTVQGQADRYGTDFASYNLSNGYLAAQNFALQCGWLGIANSTVSVAQTLNLNLAAETTRFSEIDLSSGTLSCATAISDGAGASIGQSGGAFIVTNLLKFGGHLDFYGYSYPTYGFGGGTLFASNIELDAELDIGSSGTSGRITNTGYFQHSGILGIGDANERLGRFILGNPIVRLLEWEPVGTNAVIDFTGSNTILGFADSSHETWSSSNLLTVANWKGSLSGGGNHQLKFGTNALGLASAQLNRIRFVNPAGLPAGTYASTILNTGEVVPYAPQLLPVSAGNRLVINWSDSSYILQAATNVLGPWTNVANASSPYTNNFADGPQEFFRLQR